MEKRESRKHSKAHKKDMFDLFQSFIIEKLLIIDIVQNNTVNYLLSVSTEV